VQAKNYVIFLLVFFFIILKKSTIIFKLDKQRKSEVANTEFANTHQRRFQYSRWLPRKYNLIEAEIIIKFAKERSKNRFMAHTYNKET
jgi:hypothetical protein